MTRSCYQRSLIVLEWGDAFCSVWVRGSQDERNDVSREQSGSSFGSSLSNPELQTSLPEMGEPDRLPN